MVNLDGARRLMDAAIASLLSTSEMSAGKPQALQTLTPSRTVVPALLCLIRPQVQTSIATADSHLSSPLKTTELVRVPPDRGRAVIREGIDPAQVRTNVPIGAVEHESWLWFTLT